MLLAVVAMAMPIRCSLSAQVQPQWNTSDPDEEFALWSAIAENQPAMISAILARRPYLLYARIGPNDMTPLELALLREHAESLECVLDAGASPNDLLSDGSFPICSAVILKWADGVRILLARGAVLDVECGYLSVIERIREDSEFRAALGIDLEKLTSETIPKN